MSFTPDEGHGHAHGHGTGVKWLDITVGVSAMFISVVSLVVSIQHGSTMEKMVNQNERLVAASTLPVLKYFGSELDTATGLPRFSLNVKNGGVGPALIDWFALRYKRLSYDDPGALLRACCGVANARMPPGMFYSNLSGSILPARETSEFLVATDRVPPDLQAALRRARQDMDMQACYCSVLDECWITDFGPARPRRVTSCALPKDVKPW